MTKYRVTHSHGITETYDTYEAACECIRAVYGRDAEIGHDGDLSEGGDSTLCWRSKEDARDDGGLRACAKIRRNGF